MTAIYTWEAYRNAVAVQIGIPCTWGASRNMREVQEGPKCTWDPTRNTTKPAAKAAP